MSPPEEHSAQTPVTPEPGDPMSPQPQGRSEPQPGSRQYDLFIVGLGLVAVVVLVIAIISKFTTAADVVQVAAVVLSAVTAIVSAAFGIAQAQAAAQAQRTATEAVAQKRVAEERVQTKERLVMNVRSAVDALRRDHEAITRQAGVGTRDAQTRGVSAFGPDPQLLASLTANLARVDEATRLALSS